MKDNFPGYYHDPDFKKLFNECIFVFDASVLLALYELPKEDTENLFNAWENEKLFDRLWIPYQVALEYQRNRWKSISIQESSFNVKDGLADIKKSIKKLDSDLDKLSLLQHQHCDVKKIADTLNEISIFVDELNQESPNFLLDDLIRENIDYIFTNKVGRQFSAEEMEKIYQEGAERFRNNIAPGYLDKNKDTVKRFGDLVLWKQIIDYSKSVKKPVVFITNEKKADWWFKGNNGELFGPQAELVEEFANETGQIFHMYRLSQFLKHINEYLQVNVEKETVEHVDDMARNDALFEITNDSIFEITNDSDTEFILLNRLEQIESSKLEFKEYFNKKVVNLKDKERIVFEVIGELMEEYGGRAPINILSTELTQRFKFSKEEIDVLISLLLIKKLIFQSQKGYLMYNL